MFGYTVAADPSQIATNAARVHFMGAQHVFSDLPHANVRHRPGLRKLRRALRQGDSLILSHRSDLGSKPVRSQANINLIEADGVEVLVLRPE